MTVNAITDTKKGTTRIAPTYLHTTQKIIRGPEQYVSLIVARADGAAGAAFSNTPIPHVYTAHDV